MFFQPPELEPTNSTNNTRSASALKSARRRHRKRAEKLYNKKQLLKREKQRFANTMSSWAENFTMAATWQLKHQVAHWKSKAKALEYENNILRSMLRDFYVKGKAANSVSGDLSQDPMSMSAQSDSESEQTASEGEEVEEHENDESQGEVKQADGEDLQISEEFVNFLKGNAEFRKMRLERERLRQLEEEMPTKLLEKCPDAPTDKKEEYQKLYGAHWQRIAALEMSLESQFIAECDRDKPILWPTIPLRLVFD